MKKLMVGALLSTAYICNGQSNPFNLGHTSLEHFLEVYKQVTKIDIVHKSGLVKELGDSILMTNVPNNPEAALKLAFRKQRYLIYKFTGRNILSVLQKPDKPAQKTSSTQASTRQKVNHF
jgi:hypothetical protein